MAAEPEGYRAFVAQYSTRLLRTAWLLTGDWLSAEDLVQEALARAWPKWAAIERVDNPGAYVSKIVVNVYLNGRRRRRLEVWPLPEDVPDLRDALEVRDQRQALLVALRGLAPRQRAVIALRYFDDLTERQVAEALGCSIGTVKSTAARALRALREMPGLAGLGPEEAHR